MKRTALVSVILTIIVTCGLLPAACSRGFSHQPSTINQMKMLVTPGEPVVTQALQEALSAPDLSLSDTPPSVITDINKIRLWVFANIKQATDEDLHGVNDYWQTPAETLALKAGDCEDFAILMISMMRAYGVPEDQVYVAVGSDTDKDWHAFVLDRYSYGAWVEFDPEDENDAALLGGNMPLPYDISYCFNDQDGFNGKPGYPSGYTVPTVSIVPVKPGAELRIITGITSHNASLDAAKRRLGELWLPAYIPQGYLFAYGSISSVSDKNYVTLDYLFAERHLGVTETNETDRLGDSVFVAGTFEQIMINDQPAYFGVININLTTGSSTSVLNLLELEFTKDGLQIRLSASPSDSMTHDELIKIAESLTAY